MAVKIIICLFCCCCKTLKITAKAERVGIIAPCANRFIIYKGCKILVHTVHPNIHQKKRLIVWWSSKPLTKVGSVIINFLARLKENIWLIDLFVDFMVCVAIDSNCLLWATHGQYGTEGSTKDHTPPGFRESVPKPYRGNTYFSWDRKM